MRNSRPGWIDSRYKNYSWGQLIDAQNTWDLAKAQERQNELLEEQNRLLSGNNYRYNQYSTDTSFLELLSIISVIPFVLGLIALFALPGGDQAKSVGIKLIVVSLICPGLQGLIHLLKSIKKSNQERKIREEKEKARQARIERKLNKN